MKRAMSVLLGFLVASLIVACDDEPTQQKANEEFCDDTAELIASLRVIRDLDRNSTIEEVEAARERARNAYANMIESSVGVVDARLDDLESAYEELRTAVDAIDETDSLDDALKSVDDEIEAVALNAAKILNDVDCSGVGLESQSEE